MSQTTNVEPPRQPKPSRRFWLVLFSRPALGVLLGLAAVLGAAAWRTWSYIQTELAPEVEQTLSRSLNRPVELGRLQSSSLSHLQFGPSAIPAQAQETDSVQVKQIDVNFNPWDILWQRKVNLNVTLKQPQIKLIQTQDGLWLRTKLTPQPQTGWLQTELQTIQVESAQITATPFRQSPRQLEQVSGDLQLLTPPANSTTTAPNARYTFSGNVKAGGTFKVKGNWTGQTEVAQLSLQTENLAAPVLNGILMPLVDPKTLGQPETYQLTGGKIDSQLEITLGTQTQGQALGTAQVRDLSGRLTGLPQTFQAVQGAIRLQGPVTLIEGMRGRYGWLPFQGKGTVDWNKGYDLLGELPKVDVALATRTLQLQVPVPLQGQVRIPDLRLSGPIANPKLAGTVFSVGQARIDKLNFRNIAAKFEVTAPRLEVTALQAEPLVGGKLLGRGRYDLAQNGNWLTQIQASQIPSATLAKLYNISTPIPLGQVSALIQQAGRPDNLVTQVQFQAPQAQYPTRGLAILKGEQVWLEDLIAQVGNGTLRAKGNLNQGRWQLTAATQNLPLRELDPQGRGNLNGVFNLAGAAGNYELAAIRGNGRVELSQGIAQIRQPVQALLEWNGQQIRVLQARAPGLAASGILTPRLGAKPEIVSVDLDVAAQNYDLQADPLAILAAAPSASPQPNNPSIKGRADLRGRLTGPVASPQLVGVVRTRNLQLNQFGLEPVLVGRINYNPNKGTLLQLQGQRDRLGLNLDAKQEPLAFLIQRGQATATGQRQGNQFLVAVRQFPLSAFNPQPGQPQLSGELAANLTLSRNFQQMHGQVEVAKPRLGQFVGERFTAGVTLANGILALQDGFLNHRKSQYRFQGQLNTNSTAAFSGQIATSNGQVQDLMPLLRSLGLTNGNKPIVYAKAEAVVPQPVGDPNASVADQLQLMERLGRQLDKPIGQRSRAELSLDQLQGPFVGQVNFAGSRQQVSQAQFDLRADQLSLNNTQLNQARIQGELRDGVTDIKALGVEVEGGTLQFQGRLGETRQQGKLVVANLPMAFIRRFVELPELDLNGKLQGQANLNGTFSNPKLEGQLQITEATLNQEPLRSATSKFDYGQGRLQFTSTAQFSNSEPVQIVGSLPITLPFGQIAAPDQRISLDLAVRDAGLSLLRLFTDQVVWGGGSGIVNLQVRGTLNQPSINGLITLNQASITSPLLTQPLTGITGNIRFNQDRLKVEQLTGQYQTGQLTATGVLPLNQALAPADPDRKTPLQLNLAPLDARIPNLYQGQLQGQMTIVGTALAPILGGTVQLSNGEIFLDHLSQETAGNGQVNINGRPAAITLPPISSLPNTTATSSLGLVALSATDTTANRQGQVLPTRLLLEQLQVRLGDNVKVSRSPLFSFTGTGNITINGTLDQPQPEGVVEFKSGQVNLFTSRFRLAPGQPQFARFIPSQGLDPTLDLTLLTTTTEVFGTRTNRLNEFDALPLATLGSLTSVRVQAKITGRASRLEQDFKNNVELTSTPARNQDEILALLGGLGSTTGPNNPTLALVNLAGAALFNRVQGFFNNFLGERTTFRLFPTLIPLDLQSPNNGSILGLGAEFGYDLTRQLSVSATQVLTAPEDPTQFNLAYQFNDRWRFSTSVDIKGQATGLLEYRVRF